MSNDNFDTLDNAPTVPGEPGGQVLSGRYKIVREIGSGGMGVVYLARDLELDMDVAIKVLPAILARNKRAIDNLRREAKTALKLTHSNIVRLYHFQSEEEIKYIVMEYVDGGNLEERISSAGALSVEETLKAFTQVAAGLDYAHSQNVLHRDIKPANIMLTKNGVAKLADFGIARQLKDSMTRITGKETSGTLLYMAPEQFRGGEPDHRSDIYSLAASIYECLSGHPPFWRGSIEYQVMNEKPSPLEKLNDEQNEALLKALYKEPKDRQASAKELLAGLGADPSTLSWQPSAKIRKKKAYRDTLDYSKTINVKAERAKAKKRKIKIAASLFILVLLGVTALVGIRTYTSQSKPVNPKSTIPNEMQRQISTLLSQAETLKKQDLLDKSLDCVAEVLKLDPENKQADKLRVELSSLIDKQKSIAEKQASFKNYSEAGFIYEAKEDWPKAIEAYTKALTVKPEDVETKDRLSTCRHNMYLAEAQDDELKDDLDSAIDNYSKALSYKQVASTQIKLDSTKKALQAKLDAERNKREYDKWVKQAIDAENDGDLPAAVKFYEKAQGYTNESLQSKIDSLNTQIAEKEKQSKFAELLAYAKARDNMTDGKDALKALSQALTLYPNHTEALKLKKKIASFYGSSPGDIITNSIGMKLVYIPAGEFMMGSPSSESQRNSDEGPQHRVKISKGFYMGVYEVTQAQWEAVMGTSVRQQRDKANKDWPLRGEGSNYPMYYINWDEATEFCKKLSRKEGRSYRLPTEAEWEYACRAGTTTPFNTGRTISTDQANYDGNYTYGDGRKGTYRQKTTEVGSFSPNAFGLYDMHGNVWEWCQDWYDKNYYSNSPGVDPEGPNTGSARVLRGGSWLSDPGVCRSANRLRDTPGSRGYDGGFRVVVLDFQ